jgi:hypothetical protein
LQFACHRVNVSLTLILFNTGMREYLPGQAWVSLIQTAPV